MNNEEIRATAEDERNRLTARALQEHASIIDAEIRRLRMALLHIENVYNMRLEALSDNNKEGEPE